MNMVQLPWLIARSISAARRSFSAPAGARALNPYASHVPVLGLLGRTYKVRRVLEFGSGRYSTTSFLNPELFPLLEELHSFETDPNWYHVMREFHRNDSRLTLTMTTERMSRVAERMDYSLYDLVFVDDSNTARLRFETIRAVAERCRAATLVVLHDYDNPLYRLAAHSFRHRWVLRTVLPHTCVASNLLTLDALPPCESDVEALDAARDPAEMEGR